MPPRPRFDRRAPERELPNINERINYQNLTDEEKAKLAAEENRKQIFYQLNPNESYTPSSFGRAMGSTQKAIMGAYKQAILESAITKTPIISTDVGVASEVLHEDSLFKPGYFESAKPDIDYAYKNSLKYKIPEGMNEFRIMFKELYES